MSEVSILSDSRLDLSERLALSKAIHDDVMQSLAACVLASELAGKFASTGRTDEVIQELAAIRDGVDMAISSLRSIMNELRVPA